MDTNDDMAQSIPTPIKITEASDDIAGVKTEDLT